jgi:hypothetical protein
MLVGSMASIASLASCVAEVNTPDPTDRVLLTPTRVGFEKVADAMQPSCGTLDCHGQVGRNMRMFGARGLRLSPTDTSFEGVTQQPEYDATYWAIVALEPELMSAIVREAGASPERLTLIRKGRGTERHKGGKLMSPNDDLDRCIVEWLAGKIPVDACQAAAMITSPSGSTP